VNDLLNPESWTAILTAEGIAALLTLTALEIVLGIDNVVFISILVGKLEHSKQDKARRLGLGLAMFMRILLLLFISAIMGLTKPLFEVFGQGISGKDLILIGGGLFLIAKATFEIHERLEGSYDTTGPHRVAASFGSAIVQILLLDIVFSLDSVITAVGMAQHIPVMVLAIVIAVGVMLLFSGAVSRFVQRHPTIKMLALAFLLLIGVTLMVEGFGKHVEKGYIYFAMAFSLAVELLNLKIIKKHTTQPASEESH
jgi:predicted tellurium resistance membrane protein TerC